MMDGFAISRERTPPRSNIRFAHVGRGRVAR